MNKLTLRMPHQLFIGGTFVDAEGAKTYETINPTDGSVSTGLGPSFSPSHCSPIHGVLSHLLPYLTPGGLGPGQLCLDTKGQSIASPPYRNDIEGGVVWKGWWGLGQDSKGLALETEINFKPFPPPHTSTVIPAWPPLLEYLYPNVWKFFLESYVCQDS